MADACSPFFCKGGTPLLPPVPHKCGTPLPPLLVDCLDEETEGECLIVPKTSDVFLILEIKHE